MVFASVLATGAATGAWGSGVRALAGPAEQAGDQAPAGAGLNGAASGGSTGGSGSGAGAGDGERGAEGAAGPRGAHAHDAEELVSRSGDRWSASYSEREYEGLQRDLQGEYVGVGVSVRRAKGAEDSIAVARVRPDSPAAEADLRAGDRLRSVDGVEVAGRPVTEVVALLRGSARAAGEPGSKAVLKMSRDGRRWEETLRRARLTRDAVTVQRLGDGSVLVKVSAFTEGSGAQVRRAVEKEVPEGAGVLLDLRGNSGGLVREATDAATAFLDGGLVATYEVDGDQRALYAERGGDSERPLVVLADGGTMSAAELLAGALQDRGRAVVVGSRTFGKGSVQMPRKQPDGSVAELTVGHYTTPSGRRIDGKGITPDLSVDLPDEATERGRTVLSGLATGP